MVEWEQPLHDWWPSFVVSSAYVTTTPIKLRDARLAVLGFMKDLTLQTLGPDSNGRYDILGVQKHDETILSTVIYEKR